MKSIIIYSAPNKTGSSARIASKVYFHLNENALLFNISEPASEIEMTNYKILIFIVATYGDQELHDSYEDYIRTKGNFNSNHKFSICEIGNYEGYDTFDYGGGIIVKTHVENFQAKEILPMYSIDTLPLIDDRKLNKWLDELSKKIEN